MSTTIRINKDVKELLKLKSVETGVSQIDLANRYILYGIKYDDTPSKPIKSIEEIEKLLNYDEIRESVEEIDLKDYEYEIPQGISLVKEGEENKPINTEEEIKKILKYDKPEGDDVSRSIAGIIKTEEVTDAVKLKKERLNERYK